jgi:hypothetical protein
MSWTHTQQQRLTSHKKTSSHVTAWNSSFVLALTSDTMLLTYCKSNGASGKMFVTYRNLDVTSSRNLVTSHLLISPTWLNENSTNTALKMFSYPVSLQLHASASIISEQCSIHITCEMHLYIRMRTSWSVLSNPFPSWSTWYLKCSCPIIFSAQQLRKADDSSDCIHLHHTW